MFHGVINIYKEPGFTSHDVVAKLRGILRQKKIGHTGTLDPAAEGVPCMSGEGHEAVRPLTDKEDVSGQFFLLEPKPIRRIRTGTILSEKLDGTADRTGRSRAYGELYLVRICRYRRCIRRSRSTKEALRAGESRKEVERAARPVEIYDLQMMRWNCRV